MEKKQKEELLASIEEKCRELNQIFLTDKEKALRMMVLTILQANLPNLGTIDAAVDYAYAGAIEMGWPTQNGKNIVHRSVELSKQIIDIEATLRYAL